ncbi:MAG: polysaccharide biosynthesis tyrosine autokinase [Verrucomicrobia bacterium]|nr:polysaccharide biosynthesis tyrosine autokinase [Verrucomicrobiota bacterium]
MDPYSLETSDYDQIPERRIHWRDGLHIFWERKWIVATTLVVAVTLTYIYNSRQIPIYETSARIQVDADRVKILNIEDVQSYTSDAVYLNTQVKVLQSRPLAERVVKALELGKNPDFLPGATADADFAMVLQGCLTIKQVQSTRLIDITVTHPVPKITALVANGVVQEFIKQNLEHKLQTTLDATRWLGEQSVEYRKKLEKSETAVQEYLESSHAVSLEQNQNIVLDKLKEINTTLIKAKTDRLSVETEWNQIKASLDAGQKPGSIPTIAADGEVSALHTQFSQKQVAMAALRVRYRDKYPTMAAALVELTELEAKLDKAAANAVEAVNTRYLMAKAKEESLARALTEHEQQAFELTRKLISYSALKRNAESDRQLYDSLINRTKETGITGKLETNNISMVDPARVPEAPVRPEKTKNLMYAIFLGLLGGLGLAYAAHHYDDKLKSEEEIQTHLGSPLLSDIPHIDSNDVVLKASHSDSHPNSAVAEAFHNLRATLDLIPGAKDSKVLMVTSSVPGEGKSFVASNLAIVFAQANLRTLLVDADLRRPGVHKSYLIETDAGLSAFLANSLSVGEIIHKTTIKNLDVVVVGAIPKKPAELLGSPRMRELIEEASKRYDRILIDSPPVNVVSDPLVLLPQSQGIIFVTKFRMARRGVVVRGLNKLRSSGGRVLGVVLNDIDKRHGAYYYPYYYKYQYYYGQSRKGKAG